MIDLVSEPVFDVAGVLVQQRARLREIARVLSAYGFARLASRTLDAEAHPASGTRTPHASAALEHPDVSGWTIGERLRGALADLGTTAVKLGQMLSVRPDVVGAEVAEELKLLQADVPADPAPYAEDLIAAELGRSAAEAYASFEPEPMASGSVAQVHRATLHDGTEVAVKVLHDGVGRRVRSDLELLRALAAFLESIDPELARYRPAVLVAEFDALMRAAISLDTELGNLRRFTAHFADEADVVIPAVHADLSSTRVLTMELVTGEPLTDSGAVQRLGWSLDDLVDRTTSIYLEMIFRDGEFHADPHPGNFLLQPDKKIVILDFGDVGRLTRRRREQLEELLVAMTGSDMDDLTRCVIDLTDAPPGTDVERLTDDVDRWSSQYLTEDVTEMDLTGMIGGAMRMMHAHSLSMPADLATLLRVLLLLQGMGVQLGASSQLGPLLEPYVKEMVRKRYDPKVVSQHALKSLRSWNDLFRALPDDLREVVGQLKNGRIDVDFELHDPDGRVDHVVDGLIVAALVIASGQLLSRQTKPLLGQVSVPGATAVGVGLLTYRRLRGQRNDYVHAIDRVKRVLSFAARVTAALR